MAEKLGEALLDLDTDDKKFRQGVDRAERRAEQLGATFDDVSRRAMVIGSAMAGAVAVGVAAFAAGLAGAIKRLEEMKKLSGQVDRALANSGNVAQTSAKEIEAWADTLEKRTGRAAEEVMAVASNLATYGFGKETFYRAIELANDMSAAWGGDLRQNIEGLSRALDDPLNGMAMLSKRGVKLSEEQRKLAEAFINAGEGAKAQEVVFQALEAQVKGVAEAGFGGLSKAIALAQKVWEDAFEDLVTGNDNASDLRTTLEQLIQTVSSKEFVDAAMAFGTLMVQVIKTIADAAIAAHQAVRGLQDFFASSDQGVSTEGLQQEYDTLARQVADASAKYFATTNAALAKELGDQITAGNERLEVIKAELDRRAPKVTASSTDTPSVSNYGNTGSSRTKAMDDAAQQAKVRKDVLADLQHEADLVGKTALERQILNAQRRAGVTDLDVEGQKIRELITETETHQAQIEQQQAAYDELGKIGRAALDGLIDAMKDGKIEGQELLGILGNVLSMAGSFFLDQAFGNSNGGLGSIFKDLFSGFHAKGGLIPNGQFGIVGERGPEPVIGTPRGAMVLPNSSLGGMGGGTMNVTISGVGLSQSEVLQVVYDAQDRFSRKMLPGRVREINADPLARG